MMVVIVFDPWRPFVLMLVQLGSVNASEGEDRFESDAGGGMVRLGLRGSLGGDHLGRRPCGAFGPVSGRRFDSGRLNSRPDNPWLGGGGCLRWDLPGGHIRVREPGSPHG